MFRVRLNNHEIQDDQLAEFIGREFTSHGGTPRREANGDRIITLNDIQYFRAIERYSTAQFARIAADGRRHLAEARAFLRSEHATARSGRSSDPTLDRLMAEGRRLEDEARAEIRAGRRHRHDNPVRTSSADAAADRTLVADLDVENFDEAGFFASFRP